MATTELNQIVQLPYYLLLTAEGQANKTNCLALNHRESGQIVVSNALIENHALGVIPTSTQVLTKTALAEAFANIPPGKLMQVCFLKKAGSERVLTGYRLSNEENTLGYSQVLDLEIASGNPFRLVDHRSIQWFVEASKAPIKFELKS